MLRWLLWATTRQQRILIVLRAHTGATTEVVTATLSPDLTKDLVAGTLAEFAKVGKARDEKQSEGPHERWFLT